MIPQESVRALSAALGVGALEEHAPVEVDGAALSATLKPAGGEALGRALAVLGRCRLPALVRGGGSRLDLGNRPRGARLILSTDGLHGVDEFDPGEGVCHARAGTPLAEVRARVRPHGWELPLDPPGARSTVGGAVAAGALGPRAQGFGRARDLVLGLEVVLASGERTHCGGRVVKNVTGYDLNKLYTGSLGTLGVIEGAWLRLRPRPERTMCFEAGAREFGEVCEGALEAARRPTARVAAGVAPAQGEARLAVELAGDAPSVELDAAWLGEALGAREAPPQVIEELRRLQGEAPRPCGLRFRLAALPSRLGGLAAQLREAGAALLAYPGLALLYAAFRLPPEPDPAAVDAVFERVDRLAREAGGAFLCEAAPAWAKEERDVFGPAPSTLSLMRALKRRFDPTGLLNPGRFAGGL